MRKWKQSGVRSQIQLISHTMKWAGDMGYQISGKWVPLAGFDMTPDSLTSSYKGRGMLRMRLEVYLNTSCTNLNNRLSGLFDKRWIFLWRVGFGEEKSPLKGWLTMMQDISLNRSCQVRERMWYWCKFHEYGAAGKLLLLRRTAWSSLDQRWVKTVCLLKDFSADESRLQILDVFCRDRASLLKAFAIEREGVRASAVLLWLVPSVKLAWEYRRGGIADRPIYSDALVLCSVPETSPDSAISGQCRTFSHLSDTAAGNKQSMKRRCCLTSRRRDC